MQSSPLFKGLKKKAKEAKDELEKGVKKVNKLIKVELEELRALKSMVKKKKKERKQEQLRELTEHEKFAKKVEEVIVSFQKKQAVKWPNKAQSFASVERNVYSKMPIKKKAEYMKMSLKERLDIMQTAVNAEREAMNEEEEKKFNKMDYDEKYCYLKMPQEERYFYCKMKKKARYHHLIAVRQQKQYIMLRKIPALEKFPPSSDAELPLPPHPIDEERSLPPIDEKLPLPPTEKELEQFIGNDSANRTNGSSFAVKEGSKYLDMTENDKFAYSTMPAKARLTKLESEVNAEYNTMDDEEKKKFNNMDHANRYDYLKNRVKKPKQRPAPPVPNKLQQRPAPPVPVQSPTNNTVSQDSSVQNPLMNAIIARNGRPVKKNTKESALPKTNNVRTAPETALPKTDNVRTAPETALPKTEKSVTEQLNESVNKILENDSRFQKRTNAIHGQIEDDWETGSELETDSGWETGSELGTDSKSPGRLSNTQSAHVTRYHTKDRS